MAALKKSWVLCVFSFLIILLLILNLAGMSYLHLPSTEIRKIRTTLTLKPKPTKQRWPSSIPSFLPWFSNPNLPPQSCEGFFGNGFTHEIDVLSHTNIRLLPMRNGKLNSNFNYRTSLNCYYSDTLRTSICEGRKIVMHPGRIRMARGGEPLDSVIGRGDSDELPDFSSSGAFELVFPSSDKIEDISDFEINGKLLDAILPQGQIHDHRLHALFSKIRAVKSDQINCSQVVAESTLLVIRYEYANLFHTVTDWYSAYVASRVVDLKHPPNVVFIDGHCESPMDDGWNALFSNVKYAKHFTSPICFDHVIFTPLGYETALFKGLNSGIPCKGCPPKDLKQEDISKTSRLREFGEFFKASFGISNAKPYNVIKVLFIRREDYLAHPRHGGKPEVRLQNEQQIFNEMEKWAQIQSKRYTKQGEKMGVEIINGTLAHMKMKEQIQAVHDASIIFGVHGAGLTHAVFAQPGTIILELLGPRFMRPHYSHISQWMGLEYHSITMQNTVADSTKVIEKLSIIADKLLVY